MRWGRASGDGVGEARITRQDGGRGRGGGGGGRGVGGRRQMALMRGPGGIVPLGRAQHADAVRKCLLSQISARDARERGSPGNGAERPRAPAGPETRAAGAGCASGREGLPRRSAEPRTSPPRCQALSAPSPVRCGVASPCALARSSRCCRRSGVPAPPAAAESIPRQWPVPGVCSCIRSVARSGRSTRAALGPESRIQPGKGDGSDVVAAVAASAVVGDVRLGFPRGRSRSNRARQSAHGREHDPGWP